MFGWNDETAHAELDLGRTNQVAVASLNPEIAQPGKSQRDGSEHLPQAQYLREVAKNKIKKSVIKINNILMQYVLKYQN